MAIELLVGSFRMIVELSTEQAMQQLLFLIE
jgi:hypothetical protein